MPGNNVFVARGKCLHPLHGFHISSCIESAAGGGRPHMLQAVINPYIIRGQYNPAHPGFHQHKL